MVTAMCDTTNNRPVVLAVAAHPDDIEFYQAGTLLLLKEAGCAIHMWNIASGGLGSMEMAPEETVRVRSKEAQDSARVAGAEWHESLFNDLEVFYDKASLAQVAAKIREIQPEIILTHSPKDYMEDHQNVCRLVVTATFSRGIPHFISTPPQPTYHKAVAVYHAAPHGLQDGYGAPFEPHLLVDISSVIEKKREMLACHLSQLRWLELTQGMGSYLNEMTTAGRDMAIRGQNLTVAEGWLKHNHLGFGPKDFDPLSDFLRPYIQTPNSN